MGLQATRLEKYLHVFTLLYLSLPLGIFFWGWLRPPFAIGFILLLGLALYRSGQFFWQAGTTGPVQPNPIVSVSRLLLGLLPGVLLTVLSGAGGWGFQDSDWLKHNAILQDLIGYSWPVIYETAKGPAMLVYYIAYYLPAALIGKIWGWQAANQAIFLTTLVGIVLTILWIVVLTNAHPGVCGAVFAIFSGMDVLGNLLVHSSEWEHIERWSPLGQYSSNVTLLFWVPHQGISGWLITALLLACAGKNCLSRFWLFFLALSCLWSPLVTLGLLPLFLGILLMSYLRAEYQLRAICSLPNIVGGIMGILFFCYFLAHFAAYSLPLDLAGLPQEKLTLNIYQTNFGRLYVLFLVVEFLILSLVLYRHFRTRCLPDNKMVRLLLLASLTLLMLPFFNYGYYNDLVMRASIPSLFALVILTIRTLQETGAKPALAAALLWLLLIGSGTTTLEIRRHVAEIVSRRQVVMIPEPKEVPNLFQLQYYIYRQFNFIGQYLGSVDSVFGRYLLKSSAKR